MPAGHLLAVSPDYFQNANAPFWLEFSVKSKVQKNVIAKNLKKTNSGAIAFENWAFKMAAKQNKNALIQVQAD